MARLFLSMVFIGVASHRLLEAHPDTQATELEGRELSEAEEHQRILSELEEVHQLRERMLQEGKHLCLLHAMSMCKMSLTLSFCTLVARTAYTTKQIQKWY